MQIELAGFDVKRIESIKKLEAELFGKESPSDWMVVSTALRVYEVELKMELRKRRGEEDGH